MIRYNLNEYRSSNEELENARHQMDFCFDRFMELEPLLRQIVEARTESKTLFNLYRNKVPSRAIDEPFNQNSGDDNSSLSTDT